MVFFSGLAAAGGNHPALADHPHYGFSRSLALGEFGGDGVDAKLVQRFMRQVPPVELALMLAASSMSERAENFHRLVRDAKLDPHFAQAGVHLLEKLWL